MKNESTPSRTFKLWAAALLVCGLLAHGLTGHASVGGNATKTGAGGGEPVSVIGGGGADGGTGGISG